MPKKEPYTPPGTISVTLNVPQESKEFTDALIEIMKDARDGKSLEEIAVENWVALVNAIDDFDVMMEEIEGEQMPDAFAYLVKRMTKFFKQK